jgi:quercetin dioxygenase-like cupin family protein
MQLVTSSSAPIKRPPAPYAPTVKVFFGGDDDGPDVGVVRVTVPVGAAMPEHDHGGSDVVLTPVTGSVEITGNGESIVVGVGDSALVGRDEKVALRNAGDVVAELIVAAGPTNFVAAIRAWPDAD